DVAHPHPEQTADQEVVEEGVHGTHRALFGAVEPERADDVGLVVAHQPNRPRHLRHVERKVRVAVEHEIAGRGGETCLHRPAQLAVDGVVHDTHVRVGRGHLVGEFAGVVGGGVVDDDQLVVEDFIAVDERQTLGRGRFDGPIDVGLFVPHREEHTELGEGSRPLRCHSARVAAEPIGLPSPDMVAAMDDGAPTKARPVLPSSVPPSSGSPSELPPPIPEPRHEYESRRGEQPKRPGQLTAAWRMVFGFGWAGIIIGYAAVWETSRVIGLSTWWLCGDARTRWLLVQLAPFYGPILVAVAAALNWRYAPYLG